MKLTSIQLEVTERRRPALVDAVETRLKTIIHMVAAELHCEILELEIVPDDVHLLCEVDPQFGV